MGPPSNAFIISSVRVYRDGGSHARIHVWNRGGKCGELTVNAKDAGEIAERLFGELPTVVALQNASVGRDHDVWTVDVDAARKEGLL